MGNFLKNFFQLEHNGTSISKEAIAGLTTFMAMAYILAVQPSLMKTAGMPVDAVATSTALIAGIATIMMGIYTKYPFAIAPGMGTNIFFTITLVASGIFTWQQGITIVLLSGILFFSATVFGIREAISKAIPLPIKLGIGTSVGIFLIFFGLKSSGIIHIMEGALSLGNWSDPSVLLSILGFFIMIFLYIRGITGALLIGILIVTMIGIPLGITKVPHIFVSLPNSIEPILFKFDFSGLFRVETLPFLFVFLVNDFFDTLGTLLGVSAQGGFLDENGELPEIHRPFLIDSLATIVGSCFGLTTVTTYVESAAGISAGGRTGLSSVITGILFLMALFFTPIFLMVPAIATAPCLIIIGLMLLDGLMHVKFGKLDETIAPLSMLCITAFTGSMPNGIAIGIILYTFVKLVQGKIKEIPITLWVLCILFIYYLIQQI